MMEASLLVEKIVEKMMEKILEKMVKKIVENIWLLLGRRKSLLLLHKILSNIFFCFDSKK